MSRALVARAIAALAVIAGTLWQPAPVQAQEATSPWQLRLRALGVLPATTGSSVNVTGVPALSSPNSGLWIANSIVPELDVSYYFTRNFSAELVLGVTPHNITGSGALAGLNVGTAWLLPPTLMAQYHFTDFGAFQPYFGIGANYTFFFSQNSGLHAQQRPVGDQPQSQQHLRRRRADRLRLHAHQELGPERRRQEAAAAADL